MLVQNDKIYFYHNDHRGAPESITSESGAVVWDADYTSFGKALINHGEIKNNLRLPGQYYDEETGLHYNWNRYYDPFVGRYLTADPIGLAGGINLYNYVGGNSVNATDPLGLSKWYPVPGKKGWEVQRHKPLNPDIDYYHEHYRYKGKKIPRKVDSKTGSQKPHGKGKCDGDDKDVPEDVIDAAKKGFSLTGDVETDLMILELLESLNDSLEKINGWMPDSSVILIPGAAPLRVPVFVP